MRRLFERAHPADGERGSIIILTAIMLSALVLFVSFAVDIGHEAMVRRQLIAVADIAAEDALYAIGTGSPFSQAATLATASAAANQFPLTGSNQLTVEIGTWGGSPGSFQSLTPQCVVVLPANTPGACPTAASANAVKVIASAHNDWYFIPGFRTLTALAVAQNAGYTGLQIGSFAARAGLSTGAVSILNHLLGLSPGTSLTALSYQGLATSSINLGRLATKLGFGSATDMFNGSVTYGHLLTAAGQVLNDEGQTGTSGTAGNDLISIGNAISGTTVGNTSVSPGRLAGVSGDLGQKNAAGANANLDGFGLLTGGLDLALLNGSSAISVPNVSLDSSIASVQMGVNVLQAPQAGFGDSCLGNGVTASAANEPSVPSPLPNAWPPCAESVTAQVQSQTTLTLVQDSQTTADLAAANSLLGPLASTSLSVTLPVYLGVAPGHAWVTNVGCTSPTDTAAPVDAWAHTGLASLAIGQDTTLAGATSQTDLTGGSSGNGTVQAGGVTVTGGYIASFGVTIPGHTFTVGVTDNGEVDVLSTVAHLSQSPAASPDISYTGAFPSTPNDYRGPDTIAGGNASPAPPIPTGNGVKDADSYLAAHLPSATVNFSGSFSALGVTLTLAQNVALQKVATDAVNLVNKAITKLDTTLLQPLSQALQLGVGGADVINLPAAYQAGLSPSPTTGTFCRAPEILQ